MIDINIKSAFIFIGTWTLFGMNQENMACFRGIYILETINLRLFFLLSPFHSLLFIFMENIEPTLLLRCMGGKMGDKEKKNC